MLKEFFHGEVWFNQFLSWIFFVEGSHWNILGIHTFVIIYIGHLGSNIQIQSRCMWVWTTINYVPRSIIVRECLNISGLEMDRVFPISNERLHKNSPGFLRISEGSPYFETQVVTSKYPIWLTSSFHAFFLRLPVFPGFSRRSMWTCWWHCSDAVAPPKTRTVNKNAKTLQQSRSSWWSAKSLKVL